MKKLLATVLVLAVASIALFWWLTMPATLSDGQNAALAEAEMSPDLANGELVFWAGGCGSCHAKKGAKGEDKKLLGGGHELDTPAGVFVTPNISPDPEAGIGGWSLAEFANAMLNGVSPDGTHYYPSFPYASYARMTEKDVADLFAYLKTLTPVSQPNQRHDLSPLFALRRGIGLWKTAFVSGAPVVPVTEENVILERGRYLVESLGHCGECHTPRTVFGFGGMNTARWLAGGPAPEGEGRIPNITPHASALGGWSENDIAYYLESGFTPDFDSVGGTMVSVQDNVARLPAIDIAAIAAYLKAVPEVAKGK